MKRLKGIGEKLTLRVLLIIVFAAAVLVAAWMLVARGTFGPSQPRRSAGERLKSAYDIEWMLDAQKKTFDGRQTVDYVNAETVPLSEIYFHLYPNYFSSEETAPFESSERTTAYPNGFSPGSISIKSISVGGKAADYRLEGDAQGILRLALPQPLESGARVTVDFAYAVRLPDCTGRFGGTEDTLQLCNAYPIAAVYDEDGWNLDPYYAAGDPFYSDVADYTVRIACPKAYTVTGTGNQTGADAAGDTVTYTFACPDVRDIAYVAADHFKTVSKTVDGVAVTSFYYGTDAGGQNALDAACSAVQSFNALFGAYPYPTLNIIQSDLYYGGMEYPGAVLITDTLYEMGSEDILEYVVAHEVAHQWWYAMVGNDEIDDPWLDESLTEYSTLLYYKERYGEARFKEEYRYNIELNLALYSLAAPGTMRVGRPISAYDDSLLYTMAVYKRGTQMFYELHRQMGDQAFFSAMRAYFDDMFLLNAGKEDLYAALEAASGRDWSGFIEGYLGG